MKRILGLALCFLLCGVFPVLAEEQTAVTEPAAVTGGQQEKEELKGDRKQIKAQREELKKNSEAARGEEKELRKQIREARDSGDKAKANALQDQLKKTHQENMAQRKTDHEKLVGARQDLRKDRQEARTEHREKKMDSKKSGAEGKNKNR